MGIAMGDQPRPWRIRMIEFVKYMRSRGHNFLWIHEGQKVTPIGYINRWPKPHLNNNQRKAAMPPRS